MQLYYDIPEPLKFNGIDLSNVLRKDLAMQNEIKRDQIYQTCMVVSTMTSTNPADEIPIASMLASLEKNMCMHRQQERSGLTAFQAFQNSKRSATQDEFQL
jgi:hypothetical protein